MVAASAGELDNDLDDAVSWRLAELRYLKDQVDSINRLNSHSPATRATCRSAVVLLYAHWEGFIKEACQAYVDYVARRRLTYSDLSPALLNASLRRLAQRAATQPEALIQLAEAVGRKAPTRAVIPRRTLVNTQSNLRFEVMAEIFNSLGLPIDDFEMMARLIDTELCDTRNAISHGRDNFPDHEAVTQLLVRIMVTMQEIQRLISQHAYDERFRSTP